MKLCADRVMASGEAGGGRKVYICCASRSTAAKAVLFPVTVHIHKKVQLCDNTLSALHSALARLESPFPIVRRPLTGKVGVEATSSVDWTFICRWIRASIAAGTTKLCLYARRPACEVCLTYLHDCDISSPTLHKSDHRLQQLTTTPSSETLQPVHWTRLANVQSEMTARSTLNKIFISQLM